MLNILSDYPIFGHFVRIIGFGFNFISKALLGGDDHDN